jgi:dihydrofolate reductase/thymidylate synthase
MKDVHAIVALSFRTLGIGKEGGLPWKLPADMAHFKRVTTGNPRDQLKNAVIMGRKTWESIPPKFRPLDHRINIVVSRTLQTTPDMQVVSSLEAALQYVDENPMIDQGFVIGGGQIYQEFFQSPRCQRLYVTRVLSPIECDVFFPSEFKEFEPKFVSRTQQSAEGLLFDFGVFDRTPGSEAPLGCQLKEHEEYQYLKLVSELIAEGTPMGDRTGTGTLAKFGHTMRYSLQDSFPLLTTKRVYWKGVVEELLWMIKGDTNANHLSEKGVRIWDGNGTREFLDQRGLPHREVGDLGPVYGFQWRHFGAKYETMHTDYTGQGVDQLQDLINTIKTNPDDRRLIMSAWNPSDLTQMALPPCHMFCQFYVDKNRGELSCMMYQRSCDVGLGVPFNIASYSLLTLLVAQCCGLQAKEFIHVMGNTHIYANHVEPLREQAQRSPRPFPKVRLNPDIQNIDDFRSEDIFLEDYHPAPKIQMEMAV